MGWKRIKHHGERGLKGGTPHPSSNLIAFYQHMLALAQQKSATYPGQPDMGLRNGGVCGMMDDSGGVESATSRHYRVKWLFFSEHRSEIPVPRFKK